MVFSHTEILSMNAGVMQGNRTAGQCIIQVNRRLSVERTSTSAQDALIIPPFHGALVTLFLEFTVNLSYI